VTPGAADPVAVLAVDDEPEEGLVVVLGEVEFEQLAISAEASSTAPMAAGTRTFDPPVRCRIYPPCSVPVATDRNLSCLSACPPGLVSAIFIGPQVAVSMTKVTETGPMCFV
jgi:hypothetical protein